MAIPITLRDYLTRIGTVCLVPTLLFSVWVGISDFQYLSNERDQEMREVAKGAAIDIESVIGSRIDRLKALQAVTGRAPQNSRSEEAIKALDAAFGSPLALVSAERQLIMHSRIPAARLPMGAPTPRGVSALDTAFAKNTPQVGELISSPADGSLVVPVVVPFKAQGQLLSWATSIRASDLEIALRANELPTGWGLVLVDSLGKVIAQHGAGFAPGGQDEGRRSIRLPVGDTPLTLALYVSPLAFHRAALETPLTRGIALLLIMAALLAHIRYQSIALHRAMSELTDAKGGALAADAPAQLRIAEIEAAAKEMQRLDEGLQRAQKEQQAAKDQHIRELQATVDSLARSEARMQAIFEGASEGVAILSDDLRVIRCNSTFAGMLGETLEGIRNAQVLDYSLPAHRPRHLAVFDELRQKAQSTGYSKTRGTVRVALKDGSCFTSESYTACLHLDTGSVFLMMARDVTERLETAKRLERALHDLSAANKSLQQASQMIHVTEQRERERVSRDLHDGLQQEIAALKLHLEVAAAHLNNNQLSAAQLGIRQAKEATSSIIVELHRIVNDLHPRVLEELGLVAALGQLADDFAMSTQVVAEFKVVGDPAERAGLTPPIASALYRVTQECLNNVRKHADASFVHCELNASDPRQLVLTISDDGCGFDAAPNLSQGAHGLLGIAQRVRLLGGGIEFARSRLRGIEGGATIVVTVPLRS